MACVAFPCSRLTLLVPHVSPSYYYYRPGVILTHQRVFHSVQDALCLLPASESAKLTLPFFLVRSVNIYTATSAVFSWKRLPSLCLSLLFTLLAAGLESAEKSPIFRVSFQPHLPLQTHSHTPISEFTLR